VLSPLAVVCQVATRGFRVRVVNKAFVISTAVLLFAIVVGILVAAAFGGDDEQKAQKLGIAGGAAGVAEALTQAGGALGQPVELSRVTGAADARGKVSAGDLKAAVLSNPGGSYTIVTKTSLDSKLEPVIMTGIRQAALNEALTQRGVDQQAVDRDVARATATVDTVDPPDPDRGQRTVIAYIAVLLLFFSVFFYGIDFAIGVVEEKASRVVELLQSTIKPLHLLAGKVLGIGAVGLAQLVLFGGVGLGMSIATGLITISGTAVMLFVSVLVWYILGFTFFALLYAAAGSLVSRQEDVNSATGPLSVVAFAAFFVAQFSLGEPDNGFASVLSWVPPFSATLMPLRVAQGVATPLQVVVTIVLMALASVVAALVASRIYRNSVLNTGRKQSWRQATSRA